MHGGAWSFAADEEPAEGGSFFVPDEFEVVVLEIFWDSVVFDEVGNPSRRFLNVTLKQVQGRIISVVHHVLNEVPKFHS